MADQDPQPGTSHAAPGGGASYGPEYGTVGEPQVPIPPKGEPGENTAPKAFDASNAPDPDPEPPVSDEERDGVSGTETNPEPALGVGTSSSKGAEQDAPDRPDTDTKDGRPVGTAAEGEEPDSAGGRVS